MEKKKILITIINSLCILLFSVILITLIINQKQNINNMVKEQEIIQNNMDIMNNIDSRYEELTKMKNTKDNFLKSNNEKENSIKKLEKDIKDYQSKINNLK